MSDSRDGEDTLKVLKILVVDDSISSRALVCALIQSLGHQALAAEDGLEGLARFDAEHPDMVLSDVMMPRLDGFGLLKEIRARESERWVPVILITAMDANGVGTKEQAIRALDLGADDFIGKPLQVDGLRARIRAFARALAMQDRMEQQRAELRAYRVKAEEEKRFARDLMQLLARTDRINDPQVHFLCRPTEDLSGDIIAVARTYSGKLHALLADGTGHGLTAALNVLPIVEPFYAMTAKGYSIQTILSELNNKLCTNLPADCYVAAAILAYDPVSATLEVWNGGLPDIIFRDGVTGAQRRFKSSSLPLGIMPPAFFEVNPSVVNLPNPGVAALMSDGLIEVLGDNDLEVGVQRIAAMLDEMPSAECLIEDLRVRHQGEYPDDLTIVLIDCAQREDSPDAVAEQSPAGDAVQACPVLPTATWQFELDIGPQELRSIDAVPLLHDILRNLGVGRKSMGKAFLVLSELVTNAIDHGLLRLSTESKNRSEDMEAYFDLRESRLQGLQQGQVKIAIRPLESDGGPLIEFLVADTGAGFDHATLGVPNAGSRGGRGLKLVREMCSSVEFRGTGNVVVAQMPLEIEDV